MAVSTVSEKVRYLPHSVPERMPAKETKMLGGSLAVTDIAAGAATVGRVTEMDFGSSKKVQLCADMSTAANSGADIRLQWSTNGTTWTDFGIDAAQREVSIDTTGWTASEWMDIPAQVNQTTRQFIRIRSKDGDGAADPVFDRIVVRYF